uniref:Uncharacterized protein n=1 Tax=Aureoumbra lagunensis TaxID=44058 RepID=A0A7S3K1P2_9STRA
MAYHFCNERISLELVEILRPGADRGTSFKWPDRGDSNAYEVLLLAKTELEERRRKQDKDERQRQQDIDKRETTKEKAEKKIPNFSISEFIIWLSNDTAFLSDEDKKDLNFKKTVKVMRNKFIQIHGYFLGNECKALSYAAKETHGNFIGGTIDDLRNGMRSFCAGLAQTAVPGSQNIEFILGPELAFRCLSTARVKRCSATPPRKMESLITAQKQRLIMDKESADMDIDEEYIDDMKDEAKVTSMTSYYINNNDMDDDDDEPEQPKQDFTTHIMAANDTSVDYNKICRAYDYGGKIVQASFVNGKLSEPESYMKTSAYPDGTKAGKRPNTVFRLAVLSAHPRKVVLDNAQLIEPESERILSGNGPRACAALTALCNSLRSMDQGLVARLTKPPTKSHMKPTDKLVALAPYSSDSDLSDTLLLRPLPWRDQTIQHDSPLLALFARGTTQGNKRRCQYLDDDESKISQPAKCLRQAAENIIDVQQFDRDRILMKLSLLSDDHRERVWEYLRRIASLKFYPPEPKVECAVPESNFKLNIGAILETLIDIDETDKIKNANLEFVNALQPILSEAKKERDLASESRAFNFRDAVLNANTDSKFHFTHSLVPDQPLFVIDDRVPAAISSLTPVTHFQTQLDSRVSDLRATEDLFEAMRGNNNSSIYFLIPFFA